MTSGFELSIYDLRVLGKGIADEAEAIGERVRAVDASEVERADFGEAERDGAGATYVRVVHGTLTDSLRAVQAEGEALAAELGVVARDYESAEETVHSLIAEMGEAGWR